MSYVVGLGTSGVAVSPAAAAVLLFRFLTWFVPVPVGAVGWWVWRRGVAHPPLWRARRHVSSRFPRLLWLLCAGVVVTALSAWISAPGDLAPGERWVFSTVNSWPDCLYGPLWMVQLVGVLGMPLVLAAGAVALRRRRLAVALTLLVPLRLLVEHAVLKAPVDRQRPGTLLADAVLRHVPMVGRRSPPVMRSSSAARSCCCGRTCRGPGARPVWASRCW